MRMISLLLASALALPSAADESPMFRLSRQPLLRHAFVATSAATAAGRAGVLRSRLAHAELDLLPDLAIPVGMRAKTSVPVDLNLFEDVNVRAILDSVERDGIASSVYRGAVEGDPRSEVIMAVNGNALSALVTTAGRQFIVQASGDGLHTVQEVDPAAYPDEAEPLPVMTASDETVVALSAEVGGDEFGTPVDVLVAYTTPVLTNLGSAEAVQALISASITRSNLALENSQSGLRLRLVGTIHTEYDDAQSTFSTVLRRVTNRTDGFMDDVPVRRDEVNADAVSLLVWSPSDSACGNGWIMAPQPSANFERNAYNVVRSDCANGNLSLAHEFGHNFGLHHDRANAGDGVASHPYAFGYQDPSNLFRDVMAYQCSTPCPRLPYFSNPQVKYDGQPFGIAHPDPQSADNARALSLNAGILASWRVAPPVSPRRRATGR